MTRKGGKPRKKAKDSLDPQAREGIRLEYVTRNASLSSLANRHNVPLEELRSIADEEGWHGQRDEYWRGVYTDVIHATRAATANLMAGTVSSADRLVRWAKEQMAVNEKTGEVRIGPDQVIDIARAIRVSLDVLKFTLGEPDSLVVSTGVEPAVKSYVMEEAARALKDIIGEDDGDDE